ncbi:hypothetical protein HID58_074779 [Brassica napus]|uniref:Uncharacterized protein n=1 Tax=Brassica napus TaxID=3708 RepID=A0ABQ7YHZ9_BRANA|nr:hypothetical protein HID58_074779 [Brassica napus]
MRPCQPILSKPRDGEVFLLYLKEQKHTGSVVLVQRANILLHTPEVQRSLARQTEELASIREPPCFIRINSITSGPQEDISVIADLRPAKSTRNCRTTRPTKLLLPQSCPIDLEGTPNGSSEGNGCYLDNSPHLIDIESGPSPKERLRCCIKFQRRISRDYKFLRDVRRRLRVVRRRIGLHASTKGPVHP